MTKSINNERGKSTLQILYSKCHIFIFVWDLYVLALSFFAKENNQILKTMDKGLTVCQDGYCSVSVLAQLFEIFKRKFSRSP